MRKGIIYLLMSIFLLFVAENNNHIGFQNFVNQTTAAYSFSLTKLHHYIQPFEKSASHFNPFSLGFPEETGVDDFSISNPFGVIILVTGVGFGYLLHLFFNRRKQHFYRQSNTLHSVRRFILLRSIRI